MQEADEPIPDIPGSGSNLPASFGTISRLNHLAPMKLRVPLCAITFAIAGCSSRSDEPPAPASDGLEMAAEPQSSLEGFATENSRSSVARTVENASQPKLAIDPDGLRWFMPPNGAARPLPFGMAQVDTLSSLEGVRGKAAEGINADCGAGTVQYANWADGLSLVFQNGRFAGWSLDGRAAGGLTTADGIGIGTTRAALDEAIGAPLIVRETSIGTEFTAGAYHGLFDGKGADARITDMWTGVNCVAR